MTGQELRNLLVAVEEAGGPITIQETMHDCYWINWKSGCRLQTLSIDVPDAAQDEIAGVLKRDLIERGLTIRVEGDPDTWAVIVNRNVQLPSKLWVHRELAYADGDSELEALLHAWTDAAQLEGWGS